MLLTIAVILALIDLFTTLFGVRIAGPDSESNGMHRIVLTRGGPVVFWGRTPSRMVVPVPSAAKHPGSARVEPLVCGGEPRRSAHWSPASP